MSGNEFGYSMKGIIGSQRFGFILILSAWIVFNFSIKNKNGNVTIKNVDILNCDYKSLQAECFIINDPFHLNDSGLESLIRKIQYDMVNLKKETYFIAVNIDNKKMQVFNNYKLLKFVSAGKSRYIKFFENYAT